MPTASILATIASATLGWLVVLGALAPLSRLPRFFFVIGHYVADVLVFGFIFWALSRRFDGLSPFSAMAVGMTTLAVLEVVAWGLVYKGDRWFLNFTDWIVPAFLVASVMYFATQMARA